MIDITALILVLTGAGLMITSCLCILYAHGHLSDCRTKRKSVKKTKRKKESKDAENPVEIRCEEEKPVCLTKKEPLVSNQHNLNSDTRARDFTMVNAGTMSMVNSLGTHTLTCPLGGDVSADAPVLLELEAKESNSDADRPPLESWNVQTADNSVSPEMEAWKSVKYQSDDALAQMFLKKRNSMTDDDSEKSYPTFGGKNNFLNKQDAHVIDSIKMFDKKMTTSLEMLGKMEIDGDVMEETDEMSSGSFAKITADQDKLHSVAGEFFKHANDHLDFVANEMNLEVSEASIDCESNNQEAQVN